jgi:hypothetical protein
LEAERKVTSLLDKVRRGLSLQGDSSSIDMLASW